MSHGGSVFSSCPFFHFQSHQLSASPPNSDDSTQLHRRNNIWIDLPPPPQLASINNNPILSTQPLSAMILSKDNERLRRSNDMLMSELAHMRKLYHDIIFFVQNNVKPVSCNGSFSSLAQNPSSNPNGIGHHLLGLGCTKKSSILGPINLSTPSRAFSSNSTTDTTTKSSGITTLDETKLFGVSIQSKKRLYSASSMMHIGELSNSRPRLSMDKDDLGLKLTLPSKC